jgi:hypothetical protein
MADKEEEERGSDGGEERGAEWWWNGVWGQVLDAGAWVRKKKPTT